MLLLAFQMALGNVAAIGAGCYQRAFVRQLLLEWAPECEKLVLALAAGVEEALYC